MNILVTGATGFIGRHLVKRLLQKQGIKVFCLVRKTSDIKPIALAGVEFIYSDITDFSSIEKTITPSLKLDAVYHCAAAVNNKPLNKLLPPNVAGTENICRITAQLNIPKLIYLSSVSVVSGNTQVPLPEGLPLSATNNYGQSKLLAEKVVREYREGVFAEKNIKAAIARPPIVYGADEPHFMPVMMRLLRLRLAPILYGGSQRLHMVYVETLAECLFKCLYDDSFFNGEFFIADYEVLTIKEIFEQLAEAAGVKPWHMPGFLAKAVLQLPFIGKKLGFFLKDRVYSTAKIKQLGFSTPYNANQAFKYSCSEMAINRYYS